MYFLNMRTIDWTRIFFRLVQIYADAFWDTFTYLRIIVEYMNNNMNFYIDIIIMTL